MHERFVAWLEEVAGPRLSDFAEIVAYHLERSYNYRTELDLHGDHDRSIAARAGALLAACGRRALARGDPPAAINLIERAIRLMAPSTSHRAELLIDLGIAATDAGEYLRAETALAEAIEWSAAETDGRVGTYSKLALLRLRLLTDPKIDLEDAEQQATGAIESLESSGDDLGIARAWIVLASTRNMRLRTMARAKALERAAEHAQRAGARRELLEALFYLAAVLVHGPMPVEAALSRLDEILDWSGGDHMIESSVLCSVGRLEAMRGRFDDARRASGRCIEILEELGQRPQAEAIRGENFGSIETLAGDLAAAEGQLRKACDALRALGETGIFSSLVAELALVLLELDKVDEAARCIQESRTTAAADDVLSQARWRIAMARVLAGEGELKEAIDVARQAVELLEPSDVINFKADTLVQFARVLAVAGRRQEAVGAVRQAINLFEQKGNVVSAEHARPLLTRLT